MVFFTFQRNVAVTIFVPIHTLDAFAIITVLVTFDFLKLTIFTLHRNISATTVTITFATFRDAIIGKVIASWCCSFTYLVNYPLTLHTFHTRIVGTGCGTFNVASCNFIEVSCVQ